MLNKSYDNSRESVERILDACSMAVNAMQMVHENLRKPSHAGLARARNYLDSTKRWLVCVDRLLSNTFYAQRLEKALQASSVDAEVLEIEYFQSKRVIYVHGAFDIDKLRGFLLTV